MLSLDSDTFRTNVLTLVGAIGYLAAFSIAIAEVLAGDPVPIDAVALLLLASSSCLGVDFALDFLPIEISTRPPDDANADNSESNSKRRD